MKQEIVVFADGKILRYCYYYRNILVDHTL